MTYSHMGTPTLPSAMHRFTAEFGMGSGGSNALLSSGKAVCTLCLFRRPSTVALVNFIMPLTIEAFNWGLLTVIPVQIRCGSEVVCVIH